jgi:hypothetical protein
MVTGCLTGPSSHGSRSGEADDAASPLESIAMLMEQCGACLIESGEIVAAYDYQRMISPFSRVVWNHGETSVWQLGPQKLVTYTDG